MSDGLNPDGMMWHCLETWPGRVPAAHLRDTPKPPDRPGLSWEFIPYFSLAGHQQAQAGQLSVIISCQPRQAEILQKF